MYTGSIQIVVSTPLESFGLQVLEPQGKESNGSISQPSESPGAAGGAPLSTPRVPGPNKDE